MQSEPRARVEGRSSAESGPDRFDAEPEVRREKTAILGAPLPPEQMLEIHKPDTATPYGSP